MAKPPLDDGPPAGQDSALSIRGVHPSAFSFDGVYAFSSKETRAWRPYGAPTLTDMTADEFSAELKNWIETAKHPRWDRLYTELSFQPMQEVLRDLRTKDYRTYIVTAGGQDFV